ncbi:hydroxyisourate hydrolase [Sporolactobacillus kofuensis]|uniref:5-hydroxyisourate hydrolase n=1 Tax=Sporolactobacillus kofuensis TaxID=269672 RepID=A0ABW1WDV6_9BACL|nr:hydroxyisourate hydrolase [Sporolactobacillus kofuensis]MCO7175026.1 hydroxyisourate hydrolase [Sporolactobacillus kofuensis]
MGQLTTHILDLTQGRPASNVQIDVYNVDGEMITFLQSSRTNGDGRLDAPLLVGMNFYEGIYELHVHIGDYFKRTNHSSDLTFLDIVTVRFRVADAEQNYHVPLLVSPFGYQVYRGS